MKTEKRFSKLFETGLIKRPQIVTKRGVEAAALVPIEQRARLKQTNNPNTKDLLLMPEARTEALAPTRKARPQRKPPGSWS